MFSVSNRRRCGTHIYSTTFELLAHVVLPISTQHMIMALWTPVYRNVYRSPQCRLARDIVWEIHPTISYRVNQPHSPLSRRNHVQRRQRPPGQQPEDRGHERRVRRGLRGLPRRPLHRPSGQGEPRRGVPDRDGQPQHRQGVRRGHLRAEQRRTAGAGSRGRVRQPAQPAAAAGHASAGADHGGRRAERHHDVHAGTAGCEGRYPADHHPLRPQRHPGGRERHADRADRDPPGPDRRARHQQERVARSQARRSGAQAGRGEGREQVRLPRPPAQGRPAERRGDQHGGQGGDPAARPGGRAGGKPARHAHDVLAHRGQDRAGPGGRRGEDGGQLS